MDSFLAVKLGMTDRLSQQIHNYADIYDAKMWKDVHFLDGVPYLANPYNYCLLLNVDWFNLFAETVYSASAIYLVILNYVNAQGRKHDFDWSDS